MSGIIIRVLIAIYRPPTKLREGNVFSCVCLSVHGGRGVPCNDYTGCIRPHCTVLATALSSSPPHPSSRHGTLGPPGSLILTFDGQDWRLVETCSLGDPLQSWYLVAIEVTGAVDASGRYASYWNAFLLPLRSNAEVSSPRETMSAEFTSLR